MSTKKDFLISPSLIASDLSIMGELVKQFDSTIVDLLHMDVMDGNFVPNLTFGPGFIKALKSHTGIPLDVHLMIEKPENSIDQYIECKPWAITIHYESTRFPARILSQIRSAGILSGLSINPATPVENITGLIEYTDLILIMSVDPGFYGQSFMEPSLKKIETLTAYLSKNGYTDVMIQVDGGINTENIASVAKAGARIAVAGSSAFKGGDVNSNVAQLKKHAQLI